MKAISQVSLVVAALALFSTFSGCGGGGGDGGHPLAPPSPSVRISATPSTIAAGESSALHWESTNATALVESNFGATDVSGTTAVSPTITTTYRITVAGDRGQATQSVMLTVGEPGAPGVTLTADPSTINVGESTTLQWTSTNAEVVMESNFGATTLSGTVQVSPAETTTYYISVRGTAGWARQECTVTVIGQPGVPQVTLTADPSMINAGQSTTLQWTSANAEVVMESNFGATTLSGTVQVSPAATTTYYIEVRGAAGWTRQEYTVTVIPSSSPPRASFTVTPYSGDTSTVFQLDASDCSDYQDPTSALQVRWDWEDDGTYDTDYTTTKTASHRSTSAGTWTIRLEVRDSEGLTDSTTRWVTVTAGVAISRIAFASYRDGNTEIYVMNPDGTNQIRLTNNPAWVDYEPSWSPDGNKIAFTCRDGSAEIYVMNPDGSNPVNLTNSWWGWKAAPRWSPDGAKIAFTSYTGGTMEIYVMNSDGTNPTLLSTHLPAWDGGPFWSPDGTKIAFQSNRDGNWEIYVMNDDGSNQTNLTNNLAWDSSPSWSPDGSKIAFDSDRDGNGEIYVMNSDGSNQTNLTNYSNYPASDGSPSWSPF